MKIKSKFFNEVYFVNNPEVLNEAQQDNLIMCSSKNWNTYVSTLNGGSQNLIEAEVIKDVELVEFSTQKDMFAYMSKLNDTLLLDYSVEHEQPCVLKII